MDADSRHSTTTTTTTTIDRSRLSDDDAGGARTRATERGMRRLARVETIERARARARALAFRVPPWTVGLLGTASAFARDATTTTTRRRMNRRDEG